MYTNWRQSQDIQVLRFLAAVLLEFPFKGFLKMRPQRFLAMSVTVYPSDTVSYPRRTGSKASILCFLVVATLSRLHTPFCLEQIRVKSIVQLTSWNLPEKH